MSAATSATGGTDPSATSSVSVTGPLGPYSNSRIDADSELAYYVEVVGPSGGSVPVLLSASGQVMTTDARAYAYASLDVIGTTNIYDIAACTSNFSSICNATSNPQQFNVASVLQLIPNQIYMILIETNIQSGTYSGPLPSGPFSASAVLDPTLQLGPNVSGDYSIVASANLAPAPEPSALMLVGTGLLFFLGAQKYRLRYR